MTEETNNEEGSMIEISVPRLFMAAIKTNEKIRINANDYISNEIDNKQISIEVDQENNQFVVSLVGNLEEEKVNES